MDNFNNNTHRLIKGILALFALYLAIFIIILSVYAFINPNYKGSQNLMFLILTIFIYISYVHLSKYNVNKIIEAGTICGLFLVALIVGIALIVGLGVGEATLVGLGVIEVTLVSVLLVDVAILGVLFVGAALVGAALVGAALVGAALVGAALVETAFVVALIISIAIVGIGTVVLVVGLEVAIVVALIISIAIVGVLSLRTCFFKMNNGEKSKEYCEVFKSAKQLNWLDYISIDYLLSEKQKEELRKQSIDTGPLIWRFNKLNLISSIIFVGIFLILTYYIKGDFFKTNNELILLIYFLIVIRTISRGLEIIIAFLKDIFDVNKKTTLTPGDRVKLALLSLIEITILFTVLYIPYNSSAIPMSFLESFIFSFGISTLTDVNLTFEVIEKGGQAVLSTFLPMKSLIIMFHVTIALTLLVLSLAQYVGNISSQKKS